MVFYYEHSTHTPNPHAAHRTRGPLPNEPGYPALRLCGRQRLVKVTYDGFPVVEDGDGDAKDKEILNELLVVGALKNEYTRKSGYSRESAILIFPFLPLSVSSSGAHRKRQKRDGVRAVTIHGAVVTTGGATTVQCRT